MRLLKGFLLAICGLFIVITLLSLLMPSRVLTVRTVMIDDSSDKIKEQVTDLKNWKNWHPVFKDSNNIEYSSPSKGKGAFVKWKTGDKTNTLAITDDTLTVLRLALSRPGENDQLYKISLSDFKDSTGTQVEWSAVTKMKWYPWEKFSGMFIEQLTGPGYEVALNGLKTFIESDN